MNRPLAERRILLVATSFPEAADGSEAAGAFVADFAQELARHVAVSVLAPGKGNGVARHGDVEIHRFGVPRLPLSLLKAANPLDWRSIFTTLSAGQRALDALTATRSFDHILALWALPSGYWARRSPVAYSTWALGSDIWSLGRIPVVRSVLARVLGHAQLRFADGVALAREVSAICGQPCLFLPSSRTMAMPRGQALLATAPYKLVFLGRFHPNKGVDLLLDSLSLLADADWQAVASIRIAGGGPLQSDVERAVARLREQGRPVVLEGYKNREEAQELLAWGDMVLIPSRVESIPVIFSDAMQAGKPVIATPVGDLLELITSHQVGAVAGAIAAASYAQLLKSSALEAAAQLAPNTGEVARLFSVANSVRLLLSSLGWTGVG